MYELRPGSLLAVKLISFSNMSTCGNNISTAARCLRHKFISKPAVSSTMPKQTGSCGNQYNPNGAVPKTSNEGAETTTKDKLMFRTKSDSGSSKLQSYNYGLTGPGKVTQNKLVKGIPISGEILYGIHPVLLAVTAGRRVVHKLYIREELLRSGRQIVDQLMKIAEEKFIPIQTCDKYILDSLCQARPHQGVCLDAGKLNFESIKSLNYANSDVKVPCLWVVLESVQDPMNLGAIIRSSYFLGVNNLFVVQGKSCPMTPVVCKASSGVMEIERIYAITDLSDFIREFSGRGWSVFGTTNLSKFNPQTNIVSITDININRNTILIIGNEGSGLSESVRQQCDKLITICPGRDMNPLVESLNVSVASGILLHQLCSRRILKTH